VATHSGFCDGSLICTVLIGLKGVTDGRTDRDLDDG